MNARKSVKNIYIVRISRCNMSVCLCVNDMYRCMLKETLRCIMQLIRVYDSRDCSRAYQRIRNFVVQSRLMM